MSFAAGCFVVVLMCVLAAAGFVWILVKGLGWLADRGIEPGAVALVAVLGFAAYSLVQAIRNGRP